MRAIDIVVLMLSMSAAPAYICRMDALRFRVHRAAVVLFHGLLFVGSMGAGYQAWIGTVGISEVCMVSTALLWIAVSLPSWRGGPPAHALKRRE